MKNKFTKQAPAFVKIILQSCCNEILTKSNAINFLV